MSQASLLVLIHGALMDRRSMLALTPMLPNHHAVLCPDLAGHGQRRNEHEHLTELNPRELARDLLRILPIQSLAASLPLHLVGHSLGALVAMELLQLVEAYTSKCPPLASHPRERALLQDCVQQIVGSCLYLIDGLLDRQASGSWLLGLY